MQHQIVWRNPAAELIGYFDAINRLEVAYGEGAVGGMTLAVPQRGFTPEDFVVDQMIEFRRGESGNLYLEGDRSWFLRSWQFQDGLVTLGLVDQNYLLGGRVIAYPAGGTYTDKDGAADDLMKAFVRENLGSSATNAARRQAGVSVQSDATAAPTTSKRCTREKLSTVLESLAKASREAGTYLSYDLVYTNPGAFEFRTYTGQRGADHGMTGGNRVEFSKEMGNVSSVTFREDHEQESNVCYAGGQGQEENRVVVEVIGDGAYSSPWNRREFFWDGRTTADVTALTNEGRAELYQRKARKTVEAIVQQTAGCRYGIEYRYGDLVVVSAYHYSVECRLSTVHITIDANGMEKIDLKLRGEW